MTLDWEELEDWQKIAVGLLVGLVIFSGYYLYFFKAHLAKVKNLSRDLKETTERIAGLEEMARAADVKEKQLKTEAGKVDEFEKYIYHEDQLSQAIGDVTSKAAKGLPIDFLLVEPMAPLSQGNYKIVDSRIEAAGDYLSLLSYFVRISNIPAAKLVNVKIEPDIKKPDLVCVQLIFRFYFLVGEAAGAGKTPETTQGSAEKPAEEGKLVNPFKAQSTGGEAPVLPEATAPELKLGGIWLGTLTKAVINGKIVAVGDEIEGCKVKKIEKNRVILVWSGQEIILKTK